MGGPVLVGGGLQAWRKVISVISGGANTPRCPVSTWQASAAQERWFFSLSLSFGCLR